MDGDEPAVIVGAGLAGAASAWALSRRGVPVVVYEQFAAGHRRGSSHGSARIVRRAYADALYVSLTGRAFELWRELESATRTPVLRMLGSIDFGPHRRVGTVAELLAAAAVAHELLPAGEAEARWPGMRFEGDVLFHPQAGVLDAEAAVTGMLDAAAGMGARVHHEQAAVSVDVEGRVGLAGGEPVRARCVVVAAGGWVAPLLDGVVTLPQLTVTEQPVFHFPRAEAGAPPWPSVIHEGERAVYHLAGGRDGGAADDRKLGQHGGGVVTSAAERDGRIGTLARTRAVDYVRQWLPGLEAVPRAETTCLYTDTPSEDFLLDRVGDLVVCSPCSGHGAKFAPLIGEFVADLVTGGAASLPDRFRLAAHLGGRSGSVSL